MKKYVLLLVACTLVETGYVNLALAQSTSSGEQPEKTSTSLINTETPLDVVERNIDRRLVYFNKYKQTNDIENITKLVSEENKNFYINFMKYVKSAPVFALKRDPSIRPIKKPTDDYVVTIIVSANGKEKKVSMTFIEEKTERGNKWLISDSDLHIQIPLPISNNNLGSSVITTPKESNNTEVPSSTTPPAETKDSTVVEVPSQPVATMPVINKPTPSPVPISQPKTINQKPSTQDIIILASIIVILLGGCGFGIFYGVKKRRQKKIATLSAIATVALTTPVESTPVTSPDVPSIPDTPVSNVTISTVDDTLVTPPQNIPPLPTETLSESTPLTEPTSTSEETTITEPSPTENIEENAPKNTVTVEEKIPTEELLPPAENLIMSPETETRNEDSDQNNNTPPEQLSQNESSSDNETPQVESTASDTSASSATVGEESSVNTDEQAPSISSDSEEKNSVSPQEISPQPSISLDAIIEESKGIEKKEDISSEKTPHSLFESIFNPEPAKPETKGLFGDILSSN